MLEVRDLTVTYREGTAIENVSFRLQPGQLTGLFGPNGAGKSTVLKAILGLVPVSRGLIRFGEHPLREQLKRVAYVPQRGQIDPDYPITVEKVVMMGRIPATGWFRSFDRVARSSVPRSQGWECGRTAIDRSGNSPGDNSRGFFSRAR